MTLAALVLALIATPPADGASLPLLLDFHASWCGPCKTMRPAIDQLAKAGYPIKSIDIDEQPDLAKRYKITGVPAFVIVDAGGNELDRTTGARPAGDLATMYRGVQAKLRAAANERLASSDDSDAPRTPRRTIPVSNKNDEEADQDADTSEELLEKAEKTEIPKPWETVVRIKMHLSPQEVGYGSGTVIYSSAKESIILTCAHIFKLPNRPTPSPSQFPVRIDVDLFDGRLSDTNPRTVHFLETVQGQAIDYDFINDVGLIRIRPGRRLPSSPVVPTSWTPEKGTKMVTVGCSEGHDATAWSTRILRPNAGLQHVKKNGEVEPFTVMECEHAPKQGRSGGGLYTEDGYVAGVCDFADMQNKRGLYATPKSIYRLLDRNKMTALYRPVDRDNQRLLADNEGTARRGGTKVLGQSPSDTPRRRSEISLPDPVMLGIPEPQVAANESDRGARPSQTEGRRTWQTRGGATIGNKIADEKAPQTVEMVGDPARRDLDRRPAISPEDGQPIEDVLQAPGRSQWKGIKKVPAGL